MSRAVAALITLVLSLHCHSVASEPSAFLRHFTWGAETGGSIDMSGHNQSTVDIAANFGFRNEWIKLLGIGGSIDMMISNSNRTFPVYGIFRTAFTSGPSPCFLDLRAGVTVSCLEDISTQTGAYLSGGIGFQLATGRTFVSHLILRYCFIDRSPITYNGKETPLGDLNMISLHIGVNF